MDMYIISSTKTRRLSDTIYLLFLYTYLYIKKVSNFHTQHFVGFEVLMAVGSAMSGRSLLIFWGKALPPSLVFKSKKQVTSKKQALLTGLLAWLTLQP
jgi:hypothetical protein